MDLCFNDTIIGAWRRRFFVKHPVVQRQGDEPIDQQGPDIVGKKVGALRHPAQ